MNIDTILRLLTNSGFHILGADGSFIYLEDPSCILRSFETFVHYAWIFIVFITGMLLFGWAISMIRGAKNDIFTNMRNLLLIFGTLAAVGPIINMIYGDDLFARGCRTIKVEISEVNRLLDARKLKLSERNEYDLFEEFDIYDSGAPYYDAASHEIPYADAPIASSGIPGDISVTVSPDTNTAISRPNQSQDIVIENAAGRPARATELSRDVVYHNADGTKHRRTGGSRAWRNTNPGNIRYSKFAQRMGAIGSAGGFAVFPDEETGMRAISALLRSNSYNRLTVAGAISKYAPPSENNTSAYHRQIEKLTGLSINKRIETLTDEEMSRVASAIRTIEGWTPGRIVNN